MVSLLPQSFADIDSKDNIRAIPEVLWDIHDEILDGTIIDSNNKTWSYDLKVNQVFKGSIKSDIISVGGFNVWNNFTKSDRALFYLYDVNQVSIYKYEVTDYSVKTTLRCDARSLIQISPILPNDPIKIVRGHPDIPANWKDPCVPWYFDYDPDFFNYRDPVPPKMQLRHNIPINLIMCYDDKILIHKIDDSLACVKPESYPKLIERGWTRNEFKANTPQNVDHVDPYKLNDHLKQDLLNQLRKTPRIESMYNFTDSACEFVISEMLKDKQVRELINDYQYKTSYCSFGMDRSEPSLNRYVAITFDVVEKQFSVTVTYDLQQEKITYVLGPPSEFSN